MNKIFVICGKAAAGKDTLAADLSRELNIKKTISSTTRDPREGETDKVHYNFLKNEDFKDENFIAVQEFHSKMGRIKYGMKLSDFNTCEPLIVIATPSGFRELKEKFEERVVGFYIMAPSNERLVRYLKRAGEDPLRMQEAQRRWKTDAEDFHEFEFEVDYSIINNGEYLDTLGYMADILMAELTFDE